MDSTPNPITIHQPRPISAIPFPGTKLPIKRKNPILATPKLESTAEDDHDFPPPTTTGETRPPPFKFHRIWTEPDEILFLQCLLDCSSQGLSFPRDLGIFYARFSNTMSQPYTRSQLSEKLRRLRKKFRVISSRLSKGLDKNLLSPQDRALYDLSEQLWHPDYSSTSPFFATSNRPGNGKSPNLVGVKVSLSQDFFHSNSSSSAVLALPYVSNSNQNQNRAPPRSKTPVLKACRVLNYDDEEYNDDGEEENDDGLDTKLSQVSVELENGKEAELPVKGNFSNNVIAQIAKKSLVDVFAQSLKEVRMVLEQASLREEKQRSFEKRWREQQIIEFEVLEKRLKLVIEQSLPGE